MRNQVVVRVFVLALFTLIGSSVHAQTPTVLHTGSLNTARYDQTATLLNNGMVLIAGGIGSSGYLASAELYNPLTGLFTPTGSLNTARYSHNATLLNNGQVLITGGANSSSNGLASAELYDPVAGTFMLTGTLNTGRYEQTATLLGNGKVLITGGNSGQSVLASAELYDPSAGTFSTTGNMTTAREADTATLLNNGQVLITGGANSSSNGLASAELYDPVAGTFTLTGSLNTGRYDPTATLLNDGSVLITGGVGLINGSLGNLTSTELYDPTARTFALTGSLTTTRSGLSYSAILLENGNVLITGGFDSPAYLSSTELYDPTTGTFTLSSNLNSARASHTATLLQNGDVLVAGGVANGSVLSSAELYVPTTLLPTGLLSISLTPTTPSLIVGGVQRFTATGTFSDNPAQTLSSVIWRSSNNLVATITSDATNLGAAFAVASGATTVQACTGSICGTTTLTVNAAHPTLVSISVTPASPSVFANATEQFTATGTYSDSSTQVLTNAVWTSSTSSVAIISNSGLASALRVGSTTITATVGSIFGSTSLAVTSPPVPVPLTVTLIGTGNGTVTDNFQQIDCTTTAGVQSGTCSANYSSGTVVTLTATPSAPSTFAGWGNACSGTSGCSLTMTSAQTVTGSFAPASQMITLNFTPGFSQSGMATYDCPSNPSPSPSNPCKDPNAHALALAIPQVLQPFSITVQASEVPPSVADGVCPNGGTPSTDFDCRFVTFFTYQTLANGNKIVPLCYPYANGNCVHYQVYSGTPGVEPNPSFYVGPIDWTISFNNDKFVPPAPYTGSIPQMYDDPDYAVTPTSPFGTNCSTPMQVGNPPVNTNPPIFCQFEFNITTNVNLTKQVDTAISGRTKQFNDVVIAFPPANTGNLSVTTKPSPISGIVTAGGALNLIISVSNSAGGPITSATLADALPIGTHVSWSISPAYAGPGTCAITGAVGSQVLNCSFGTIAARRVFTISLASANSSLGKYTNTAIIRIGNQQILTIGAIIVTIPGDVNGDGIVNCADLDIVKASFGKKTGQTGFDPRADVNHDGVVNILDLAYVARQLPAGTACK